MSSDPFSILGRGSVPHSVYLHLPFCARKCSYCDFFSVADSSDSAVSGVLESINGELRLFLDSIQPPSISTLYIGGGTPSAVPRDTLQRFLENVMSAIGSPVTEFTVEANPESLDKDFVEIITSAGATRLSLGIQSMSPIPFRFLTRPGSIRDNEKALSLMGEFPELDLNIDLMSGIPGSDIRTLKQDFSAVTMSDPDHVSWYSLTVEPNTRLEEWIRTNRVAAVEEWIADVQWLEGSNMLEEMGYSRYEISNFSRSGKRCLHNMGYWEMNPYIGCGPAAASTVSSTTGQAVRIEHSRSIDEYVAGSPYGASYEVLSATEFSKEMIMMGMRTIDGVKKDRFERIFGRTMESVLQKTIGAWADSEYIEGPKSNIALTSDGLSLLDRFLVQAFAEMDGHRIEEYSWPV